MTRRRLRGSEGVALSLLALLVLAGRLFLASSWFDLHANPGKKVVIVFRNDDIQEYSGSVSERRFLQLFAENGIPQTYALVPFKKDLEKEQELLSLLKDQQARGLAEIALHGYAHRDHAGGRRSEFVGIPLDEQAARIGSGKVYLERVFQKEIVTFIPPFNSYDENTLRACAQNRVKVLSSSPFFSVPNPYPLPVVNFNFLLTDPGSILELASNYGNDLSVFIVYYHSYMENIYRNDDYYEKAARLIRVIRQHGNIEVDTLGNVALRYAGYFKERITLDTWRAKTSVLLNFYKQFALMGKLSLLYHCGESQTPLFILLCLLHVAGAAVLIGFVLGFAGELFLDFIRVPSRWRRRIFTILTAGWIISFSVVVAEPRFGIIDISFGLLFAGFLVPPLIRLPERIPSHGEPSLR